ncbi:hypothetical protein JCM19992_12870 [Thermostilla marina]
MPIDAFFRKPQRRFLAESHTSSLILAVVIAAIFCTSSVSAKGTDKKITSDRFIRAKLDDSGTPVALQTAIVGYANPKESESGLRVDLVGVIHIGDAAYYDKLNRILRKYDVVLYELVAPEGTRIPRGGAGVPQHPISAMQMSMKELLELEYQLDRIDYTRENFVHADMNPTEFARSMAERDESLWKLMLKMMGYEMARSSAPSRQGSDADFLAAFFSKNRALALKRVLCGQMADDATAAIDALAGEQGSTLIAGRNAKALEVLDSQIEQGAKKIAIFYGAGHMNDFDKRLRTQYGLEPVEVRWLTAWDLSEPGNDADGKPPKTKNKNRRSHKRRGVSGD